MKLNKIVIPYSQIIRTSIIILVTCTVSFSQNYKEYYALQNKAELAIVDNDFHTALDFYSKAFALNPKPLAKDIYNYAMCSFLLKKYKNTYKSFNKLMGLGLSIEEIKKNEVLIKEKEVINRISKNYTSFKDKSLKNINVFLRDSLRKIADQDQLFRRMSGSYKVYGDTIRKIDKENNKKLLSIIEKYGYPNEYLVGVSRNLNPSQNFDIVIWHQTQTNFIHDYTNILKEAVKKGRIDPHRASELIENQQGDDRYSSQILYKISCPSCSKDVIDKINKKLFYYDIKDSIKAKINDEREKIFLENIDDYEKKVLFDSKPNPFKFFYKGGIPNFNFDKEEDVLITIKKMKSLNE